jgi:hypothetical protein
LAERPPHSDLSMRGHLALQVTCLHMGEFAQAKDHFEKALLLDQPGRHLYDAVDYWLHDSIHFVQWNGGTVIEWKSPPSETGWLAVQFDGELAG